MRRHPLWSVFLTVLALVAATTAAHGAAGFLEDDVMVLDTLVGEEVNGAYGWVAANVGDLDGDGVDDLAVPEIAWSAGAPFAGKVTVYSGATRAVLAEHEGEAYDYLGYSLSGAGDVDADGVPDYVAAAPSVNPASVSEVVVWSGADHQVIWRVEGEPNQFYWTAVSAAGDLNGDGYGDVVAGARSAEQGAGLVQALSGADGSVLWSVVGRKAGDNLGAAAGLVGDVDADGVPDVVVGVAEARKGRGVAYVLSGVDGSRIHRLNPRGDGQEFGVFFTSGAGDGDGVGDVFVGDYNAGMTNRRGFPVGSGAAYVYSGRTGQRILRFEAEAPGDGFGPGRGVGDVDGDGHADLVIAAYTSSAGAPGAGKATVYSGRTKEVLQGITSTTAGEAFGVDALSLGDVDGDGRHDFVVTAVGLSFSGLAPGSTYVIAGTTP